MLEEGILIMMLIIRFTMKISPTKVIMRFDKNRNRSPSHIGPYKIL